MPEINMRRWLLSLIFLLLPAAQSFAAESLSPRLVRVAYQQVDQWVREWDIPRDKPVILDGVQGVKVTLRMGGSVIGRGVVLRDPDQINSRSDSDDTLLARAVTIAMRQARKKIPVERDALEEESLRQAARAILIDVELADEFIPLQVEDAAGVYRWTADTSYGLAANLDGKLAAIFPGTMHSGGQIGVGALRAVMGELGTIPLNLKDLLKAGRITLYRFRSLQRAQPAPGVPSRLMHRGGKVVELTEVRRDTLLKTAQLIAGHIESRLWPGDEQYGLMEVYRPWIDDADPGYASTSQDALAAFALIRFSKMAGPEASQRENALASAMELLNRINKRLNSKKPEVLTVDAASLVVVTCLELPDDLQNEKTAGLLKQTAEILQKIMVDDNLRKTAENGSAQNRAILVFALASLQKQVPEITSEWRIGDFVDDLWNDVPPNMLPDVMPFLGWAEQRLHGGGAAHTALLRNMRQMVWDHQVEAENSSSQDRDLLGGVIFSRGTSSLPTWQTVRPVAYIASMLQQKTLTRKEEIPSEVVHLTQAMRFLIQLTMREDELYMAKNPTRARGGVRAAVWDNHMPIDASSLSLLTITEMLNSLDHLASP